MNLMFGLPETTGLDRGSGRSLARHPLARPVRLGWRRVRHQFSHQRAAHGGAHAPAVAMARRRPRRAGAMVAGMWWWGFDFGQIFCGFNRKEIEARLVALNTENAQLAAEATTLRASNATSRASWRWPPARRRRWSGRARNCRAENTQIKEELAFLQKLVVDSNKLAGVAIQRLDRRARARRHLALQPAAGARRQPRATSSRASVSAPGHAGGGTGGAAAPRGTDHREPARGRSRRRPPPCGSDSSIISGLRARSWFHRGAKLASLTAKAVRRRAPPSPRATRTLMNP